MIEFLLQVLGNEESDKVQALICAGFAKLMLSGMISDERVCYHSCYNRPPDRPPGSFQPGVDLPLARYSGKPRAAPMLVLFFPSLQLFISHAPTPYAGGAQTMAYHLPHP